jgi:hypothetical protein
MENLMTTVMLEMTQILSDTHSEIKTFKGKLPYGLRKATPKEQRQTFENLTVADLSNLIQTQGRDKTSEYLGRFMPKGE